ncbi:MAG: YfhO family protein [bacterium]|nr:YfhO family protein [bacterium]
MKLLKRFPIILRKQWAILALLTLSAIFMWRVVFLGQVMMPLDAIYSFEPWHSEMPEFVPNSIWNPLLTDAIWATYPNADYAAEAYQQRNYFWDPYILSGMPAMARGELFSSIFYIAFSIWMPPAYALSWILVIHVFLGALFMFLLLREMNCSRFGALAGSLIFAFNGYLIGWLSLPTTTVTMIWIPFLLFGIERSINTRNWRWSLVSSVGFFFQIMSGYTLWAFYAAVTVCLYLVCRSIVLLFKGDKRDAALPLFYGALAFGIGALVAAPQLLITAELFLQTLRTQALGANSFLPLTHLLRLMIPNLQGNHLHGGSYIGPFNYTETDLYFGIFGLVGVVASLFNPRRRSVSWTFFGIGLTTLLAVYNIAPFRQIINLAYPIFLNTFPGRIFYVTAFVWAVAAGLGIDWIAVQRPQRVLRLLAFFLFDAAFILLIVCGMIVYLHRFGPGNHSFLLTLSEYLFKYKVTNILPACLWLFVSGALTGLWGKGWISGQAFKGGVLILIVVDLFSAGIDYNSTFRSELAFPSTPSLQFLQKLSEKQEQPYRILSVNSGFILPGNTPGLFRLPTVSGYSSFIPQRFSSYADLTGMRGQFTPNNVYFSDCCNALINAMNVQYVYVGRGTILSSSSTGSFDLQAQLGMADVSVSQAGAVGNTSWLINGQERSVLYAHPTSRIRYEITPAQSSVLRTGIVMDSSSWDKGGDGVSFQIYVKDDGHPDEVQLFSQYINPKTDISDRKYQPIEIDLSQFAGKKILLSLVTNPGPAQNNDFDWAGWVEPRIDNYLPSTLKLIYDGPNKVYENLAAFPRAWVVRKITQVPLNDQDAVKSRLLAPDFDPATEAVIESNDKINLDLGGQTNTAIDNVQFISYSPESLEIDVALASPGLLVLSDTIYPGWQVYVDGQKKAIYPTNLTMRGVWVDTGQHRVSYVYEPILFWYGLGVSSLTCVIVIIVLVGYRRRQHLYNSFSTGQSSDKHEKSR